jgi:hypothetical protein
VGVINFLIFAAVCFFPSHTVFAGIDTLKNYKIGDWKVDVWLEERLRYEYKSDFDFNDRLKDSGSLLFNRIRIKGKLSLEDNYELFLEGLDAKVGNYQIKKTAQTDDLDLYQAYIKIKHLAGSDIDLKAGRQELNYGKGRLIASSAWSNRLTSFDAAVLHYAKDSFYGDAFIGYQVKYYAHQANHLNGEEMISGIYLGQKRDKKSLLESYFLSFIDNNKKATGHIHRFTVGVRSQASFLEDYAYDFEVPLQFGKDGTKDISAYAVHLDVSRKFDIALKPKLTLEFNLASGDHKAGDNKNTTFIPLYQTTHTPYGIMDFFRLQNMREAAVNLAVLPCQKLQVTPEMHFFWLDDVHDSWYNSSGTKLRTGTKGNESSFVGTETSIVAKYELTKYIQLESGYAHFFTGQYVKDTGANDDADFVYSQMCLKF